jgi:hypothetical protein
MTQNFLHPSRRQAVANLTLWNNHNQKLTWTDFSPKSGSFSAITVSGKVVEFVYFLIILVYCILVVQKATFSSFASVILAIQKQRDIRPHLLSLQSKKPLNFAQTKIGEQANLKAGRKRENLAKVRKNSKKFQISSTIHMRKTFFGTQAISY